MSTPTQYRLYPAEGWGAPKDRHGHSDGTVVGLPAGTEIFSADNHISVADDIFYERFPEDLKGAGAADLVRGRRLHGRAQGHGRGRVTSAAC